MQVRAFERYIPLSHILAIRLRDLYDHQELEH